MVHRAGYGADGRRTYRNQPVKAGTANLQYEIKYSSGEFEPADYLTLAESYGTQGRVKEQRDMLEQIWRLYENETAFSALSEIMVNVREEEKYIRSQAELIMQNQELEEYNNDAVNQISTEEWFSVMMPKLYEGQRNYYLEADGTGQVCCLKKEEAAVRMLMMGLLEESAVIYAYDEEKKKFLYVRPKDETEGAVFRR